MICTHRSNANVLIPYNPSKWIYNIKILFIKKNLANNNSHDYKEIFTIHKLNQIVISLGPRITLPTVLNASFMFASGS